jgi:hypothetical protein
MDDEPDWHMTSEIVSNYRSEANFWTTSYFKSPNSRYDFPHLTPLEITVRWLYMHVNFREVRQMRELESFDHSINRLIEAGEGLFSPNTYQELCGFTPTTDNMWRIYTQTHSYLENGNYVEPTEHYTLKAKEKAWSTIKRRYYQLLDENTGRMSGQLLLSPDNRLGSYNVPSYQRDRTRPDWDSIFKDYQRLTPWEQITENIRLEGMRDSASDFERSILGNIDPDRKPN